MEAPTEVTEERPEVKEDYQQQYGERRRLRRSGKLNLAGSCHTCGADCHHERPPLPSRPNRAHKSPVTAEPKSWFQKYAELSLVEREAPNREVNAVPKVNQDAGFEIISVTADSGAYNAVGPPQTGTYFNLTHADASAKGRHY